jgi:type VI secretion system protein ImpB
MRGEVVASQVFQERFMSKVPYEGRNPITLDVESEGGEQGVELPFGVLVVSDLDGNNPQRGKKPLDVRKPADIHQGNFDQKMQSIAPGLSIRVPNTLDPRGGELHVELAFNSMDDFGPESIVKQVGPLRDLLEMRELLRHIHLVGDRSDSFEELLEKVFTDPAQRKRLQELLDARKRDGR